MNLSASLTQVLRWAYWWNSTEDSPEDVTNEQVLIELNTDFSSKGMAAPEIQAIVAAWQAGAISRDTMTDLFRRGEVLPEGRTNEEEVKLLAASLEAGAVHDSASNGLNPAIKSDHPLPAHPTNEALSSQ